VLLLVLSLVSELLGDGLHQLVNLVQESSFKVLELFTVGFSIQSVLNLSKPVIDFILKALEVILEHGEKFSQTFELFIVIVSFRGGTLRPTVSELLEHLFKYGDTLNNVGERLTDVLLEVSLMPLNFETDSLKRLFGVLL
jgi:hypothetical protein